MREPTVEGKTPDQPAGWKGLSGGPIFHLDSGALLGVFGRVETASAQRALAATPFSEITDDRFWTISGLPKPAVGRVPTWRQQARSFRASDYLYLFDRGRQVIDFERKVATLPYEKNPLIIVIIGRISDIPDELLRRFELNVLSSLFHDTKPYKDTTTIDWPKTNDNAEQAVKTFFQDVASKIRLQLGTLDTSKLVALHKDLASSGALGFRTYLRASTFGSRDKATLKQLFTNWSRLGPSPLPPVLFIVIYAPNNIKAPDTDESLLHIRTEIELCAPPGRIRPAIVMLDPLTDCEHAHFPEWEHALAERGCDDPIGYVLRLKTELSNLETFPLIELQMALSRV
jgi:hypothetical protein